MYKRENERERDVYESIGTRRIVFFLTHATGIPFRNDSWYSCPSVYNYPRATVRTSGQGKDPTEPSRYRWNFRKIVALKGTLVCTGILFFFNQRIRSHFETASRWQFFTLEFINVHARVIKGRFFFLATFTLDDIEISRESEGKREGSFSPRLE